MFSFDPMHRSGVQPQELFESLLANDPHGQLAFESWELDLIANTAQACPDVNWVLRCERTQQVAGMVIGGDWCGRATISHIVVGEEHRSKGAGHGVVMQTLDLLRQRNVRRAHVIVTAGNDRARKFWGEHLGFVALDGALTLERDIDSECECACLEELIADDVSSVSEMFPDSRDLVTHLREVVTGPRGTCLLSRNEKGEVSGLVTAGTFGVRGYIEEVLALSTEHATCAIQSALAWLSQQGVRRAHTFVEPDSFAHEALLASGFRMTPGETTYVYHL